MRAGGTCWTKTGLTSRVLAQPGHFGEWLQGRLGPAGPVVLVSLPYPGAVIQAWHRPGPTPLRLHGAGMTAGQARRFLTGLGYNLAGRVRLRPVVPPGQGMGVSTAGLVALARLAGFSGPAERLAQACIRTEGASDPLWHPAPERLLWAPRRGQAVADLPFLPRYHIVGGVWGRGQATDPHDQHFPDISDLIAHWRGARSLADHAQLSSESAARCVALRGPASDPTAALARDLGALGWVAAHTGGARGLIFAPGSAPTETAAQLRAAGYGNVVAFQGGGARSDNRVAHLGRNPFANHDRAQDDQQD